MNLDREKGIIMHKKKYLSTYERLINEDPNFEKDLNKRYKEFILSELIIAIMQEDHISIRKLAKEACVSPSLIQDLRTGKRENLTLKNFSNIMDALGYNLILEKRVKTRGSPRRLKMNRMGGSRTRKKSHSDNDLEAVNS